MAETVASLGVRLKAFVLARLDMDTAHETAAYLLGAHAEARGHDAGLPLAARKTLETGWSSPTLGRSPTAVAA
jgi:hypothetical protein